MSNILAGLLRLSIPVWFPPALPLFFYFNSFFTLREINFASCVISSALPRPQCQASIFYKVLVEFRLYINKLSSDFYRLCLAECVLTESLSRELVKDVVPCCLPPSTGPHGAGVQAVQSRSCHLHVFPSRRRQQFRGGQRRRLRLHVMSSWKVRSQAARGPRRPSRTPPGNWGSLLGPPRTGCQINIAHSLPSATQIQHLISRCLRFRSCPVILFFFSACQLCL